MQFLELQLFLMYFVSTYFLRKKQLEKSFLPDRPYYFFVYFPVDPNPFSPLFVFEKCVTSSIFSIGSKSGAHI